MASWLADPVNLVPVHATARRDLPAGAPRWTVLSLLITGGATDSVFAVGHQRGAARRALIEAAAARGRTQSLSNGQAIPGASTAQDPPAHGTRGAAVIDAGLRRWLAETRRAGSPSAGVGTVTARPGRCCGRPWPG